MIHRMQKGRPQDPAFARKLATLAMRVSIRRMAQRRTPCPPCVGVRDRAGAGRKKGGHGGPPLLRSPAARRQEVIHGPQTARIQQVDDVAADHGHVGQTVQHAHMFGA